MNKLELNKKITGAYVKSMIAAEQTIDELMHTKWGKYAVAVPMALSGLSVRAYADEGAENQANEMLKSIMDALGPGVIALGTLVAVVGGIQLGKGFTRDDADSKASGMMTMIGGIIIGAVGTIVKGIDINLNG